MNAQLYLPGFLEPVAARTGRRGAGPLRDRLFLALMPDRSTADQILKEAGALQLRQGLTGALRPAGHLHATIYHVGDFLGLPEDEVEFARDAGEAAASRISRFEIVLDRALSFESRKEKAPLVFTGDGEESGPVRLKDRVITEFSKRGPIHGSPFNFHVTVAYTEQRLEERAIEPIVWRVREMALIHSLVGRTKYIKLGSWPLVG